MLARHRISTATRRTRVALVAAAAVAAAGYVWTTTDRDPPDASWQVVELDVEGLDCAFWCSVKVADAVDALPGARADAVDAQAGTVRVRIDPARRRVEDVVRALEERGFPVIGVRRDV